MNKYQFILFFIIIIILILLFNYFNKFLNNKKNFYELFSNNNENNVTIVVAHYNEDLSYLDTEPFSKYKQIIYTKGTNKPTCKNCDNLISLPNVGMNIHTYFKYIIDNYDNLPNFVIFLPGSCLDEKHGKRDKTNSTLSKFEETKDSVFYVTKYGENMLNHEGKFQIDNYNISNINNRDLNNSGELVLADTRPFGAWYNKYFPNIEVQSINFQGVFVVSKELIRNRSKESYEELIKQLEKDKNTEVAHYFERVTIALFHPVPDEVLFN